MPETKDPAKLTKEQLKRELKKHGVKLPDAQALKAEYVNLYKNKILKKKKISGFSSEEDDEPVVRITRSAKKEPLPSEVRVKVERIDYTTIRTMTSNGIMVSELSNEELRDELEARGSNIGPIVETTRKLYERKLEKLLRSAGMGDAATGNGTQEYSDQESDEEEEEEVEVEEPTPIQTRNRRSLLRSGEKEFSSAPNLTSLPFTDSQYRKPQRPTPTHTPKPLKRPSAIDSAPANSPAWQNISLADDMVFNKSLPGKSPLQVTNGGHVAGGYEVFQRGVHTDRKSQGGLRPAISHNSFLEVANSSKATLNVDGTTMGDMSSLRLDSTNTTIFSDLENTLRNADEILNSTQIEKSYRDTKIAGMERPLNSHLTRDLLSPNLPRSEYTKRIQLICGSATRRRAMRTRTEVYKQEEEEEDKEEEIDEAPTPFSGEKIMPARSERRWVPVWVAILIVIAIVAFLYFVISAMEENPAKPFLP